MTQIQTIFLALHRIKRSDAELFFAFMEKLKRKLKHQGYYRGKGVYQRDIIFYGNNGIQHRQISVSIPRFHHPGHTESFSFLPDFLVPHSSYTVRFILTTLLQYESRSCTTEAFCSNRQIAPSTLYEWKHLLELHCSRWLQSLKDAERCSDDILSTVLKTRSFLKYFSDTCHHSFLMRCCMPVSMISFQNLPQHIPP